MGNDAVAASFAAWAEAHRRHVQAERALEEARRVSEMYGGTPPDELAEQVKALRAESDRLLKVAEAALMTARGK